MTEKQKVIQVLKRTNTKYFFHNKNTLVIINNEGCITIYFDENENITKIL